jgi:thiol-disulfide isomerase/thioredoxin
VFWEVWCPFSQRTMPSMEKLYRQYREQGLEIIGITEVDRSATDKWVEDFVAEKKLTYPVLKCDGTAWDYFDCKGTPWVYIVQDKVIVWENDINTPEKFPRGVLDKLLSG